MFKSFMDAMTNIAGQPMVLDQRWVAADLGPGQLT